MFNVGNQVVVKAENKQGFIYSLLDKNNYMVGIKENGMLKVQIFPEHELELKVCKLGANGLCDYVTDISTQGMFACVNCELKHGISSSEENEL